MVERVRLASKLGLVWVVLLNTSACFNESAVKVSIRRVSQAPIPGPTLPPPVQTKLCDLSAFRAGLVSNDSGADLNKDGFLNQTDEYHFLKTCSRIYCDVDAFRYAWDHGEVEAADIDEDGGIEGMDVEAFWTHCREDRCDRASFELAWESSDPKADFNLDGGVDGDDQIDFMRVCVDKIPVFTAKSAP